jgi:GNAT superfamily N-acetyltransferase
MSSEGGPGVRAHVLVRPAGPADLAALLGLYDELAEDRPESLPADREDAGRLLAAISTREGRALLVAVVGGLTVGTADLLVSPNLTHGGRPWAIVENVVVAAGARRQGVGRALIEDVVRRCESAGCYKIQLLSRRHRHAAHSFYESVGFRVTAEGFRRYLA